MSYLTTADVLKFSPNWGVDPAVGLVSNVLNAAPLIQKLAARSIPGFTYKYTRKTADPSVGFRNANDGRTNSVATYDNITVALEILDATFWVDVAVAEADDRGVEACLAQQAADALEAAFFEAEKCVINGDADGFDGFADLLGDTSEDMVVNAEGSTALSASSVYAVRVGLNDCHLLWGQNGIIAAGDRSIVPVAGSSTGTFPSYYTPVTAWCGLQVGSAYSVGRIANLTVGKPLDDDLLAELIAKFPAAKPPTLLVMNRRSLMQLQQSRTATNPTGSPAPFPSESFTMRRPRTGGFLAGAE
jgi:hypothetical protein